MKTIKSLTRLALFAFGLSALAVGSAFAASNVDGYVYGTVVSTEGTSLTDATVTISNEETGVSRTVNTDADGAFRFPSLSVGTYNLTIEESGYQTASRTLSVNIGVGTNASVTLLGVNESAAELGTVTVTGAAISPIDITATSTQLTIGEAQIDRIPVARSQFSVALLAPGVIQGESDFPGVSFAGSTPGENVCYINGLDVTNFRTGLGCSSVPFEFFEQFQVKTGGLSAEFGRTTGGVISAVTKSGTNEFHWGANIYWSPWIDDLTTTDPNLYAPYSYAPQTVLVDTDNNPATPSVSQTFQVVGAGGALLNDNKFDESTFMEMNVWASGPIIEDKLFFFILANPRSGDSDNYSAPTNEYFSTDTSGLFWGTKIDWFITDNHKLELTAWSDEKEDEVFTYAYTGGSRFQQGTVGAKVPGFILDEDGGQNAIIKYTGYLTPNFTLSASYGVNKYSVATKALDTPLVISCEVDPTICPSINNPLGGGPYGGPDEDEREQFRIDALWYLGADHTLKFGVDYQTRSSTTQVGYTGTETYASPNPAIDFDGDGTTILQGGNFYVVNDYFASIPGYEVLVQHYSTNGSFETETNAIYVEDQWQVSDNFLLSLGLRNEQFVNKNAAGEAFIDINNQIAPRIGFAWDVQGDGSLKFYGNYGRYYLPVANNTNVRMAGNELFIRDFYVWGGGYGSPYNIPTLGAYIGSSTFADGTVKDAASLLAEDLEPMYQDEYILGLTADAGNGWVVGGRVIYRDLLSTIEDAIIGLDGDPTTPPAYAIINPGEPVTLCDDSGNCTSYTAEQTGFPLSVRKYLAWQFTFEKVWNGEWYLSGSYTWSHSWGNNEGYVKSDNSQTDAGITTNFDYPGLMDYAYGNLPNDRRHAFKVYGAWKFAEHWMLGSNVFMHSGRPINALGIHPTDPSAASYGAESFYWGGEPAPRGYIGTTPFITTVNMNIQYMTDIGNDGELTLGLSVFNIFDAHNATEVDEQAENGVGSGDTGPGLPQVDFLTPEAYQAPRSIRLKAEVSF